LLRLPRHLALGEDDDAPRLADPLRERDAPADRLVGLAGVDAKADRDLDRLVELRLGEAREDLEGLFEAVALLPAEGLHAGHESLAASPHPRLLPLSRASARAPARWW